jgi:hypothetical protein
MGIYVVRAFVQIRQVAALHADVDKRLHELMTPPIEPIPPKRQIGFITNDAPPKPATKKAKTTKR